MSQLIVSRRESSQVPDLKWSKNNNNILTFSRFEFENDTEDVHDDVDLLLRRQQRLHAELFQKEKSPLLPQVRFIMDSYNFSLHGYSSGFDI